ncbi:hypothetical protein [Pseudoalteromonas phenolica]|uniref:Uncharacterized protein n=1 Tax=Pseudoalteromonas phenolica TaxID=161398 RepID=A0A0S2K2F1_9GAMM|nr:hypothetical protein [Pseudoalteromonas phenolica]ALO42679.1 hypothetical protein PP2015_2182 [Pseudoalteromonas phenolica]MBE0356215.1 hypothetical protein [Pseudoalteromonas phenolica O-BC30]RXE91457.1 hypothetical protein D9981_22380 [Pseudoalteromonas phenolica O-BC30]
MVKTEYVAVSASGEQIRLCIEVSPSEPDPLPGGDFRCRVRINAFDIDEFAYGVDALQAYCLSVKLLKIRLDEKQQQGWQFYFPGHLDHAIDFNEGYF